jgi:hypothetical protein
LPVPGVEVPLESDSLFQNVYDRLDVVQQTIWRIRGLADTILSAHDKFIDEQEQQLVCRLPARGFGALDFDMPAERMEAILHAGEAAMEAFFNKSYSPIAAASTS